MWNVPYEEEEKILALQTKLNAMKRLASKNRYNTPKKLPIDLQDLPRRKPLRGIQRSIQNGSMKNIRKTAYLNPVRIGTGAEHNPVASVTDVTVALGSIQERATLTKMQDPCRAPRR